MRLTFFATAGQWLALVLLTTHCSGSSTGSNTSATNASTTGSGNASSNANAANVVITMPSSLLTIPLGGCSLVDYMANVTVGDQNFQLIVDTGSMTLALASEFCRSGCSGLSPLYTPSASATQEPNSAQEEYGVQGDITGWDANIYTDTVTLGNGILANLRLAAITSASTAEGENTFFMGGSCIGNTTINLNLNQGLIGLGGQALDPNHITTSLIDTLKSQNSNYAKFTVQLCDVNGTMWWGGAEPNSLIGQMNYVALNTSSGYYEVTATALAASQTTFSITETSALSPMVVDTGTSDLVLPTNLYNNLLSQLANNANYQAVFCSTPDSNVVSCNANNSPLLGIEAGNCVALPSNHTRSDVDGLLPYLNITFNTTSGGTYTLSLPSTSSYLSAVSGLIEGELVTFYCGAIADIGYSTSESGNGTPMSIFGNIGMHNNLFYFDYADQALGIATPSAPCSKLQ